MIDEKLLRNVICARVFNDVPSHSKHREVVTFMEPGDPVLRTGGVQGIEQGIRYLTWKTVSSSGHPYSRKFNSEQEGSELLK